VSVGDLQRLPPVVMVVFVVMLWPAIWAAAGIVMALVTDILRAMKRHDTLRRPAEGVVLRRSNESPACCASPATGDRIEASDAVGESAIFRIDGSVPSPP
jgi:hypothetical protein